MRSVQWQAVLFLSALILTVSLAGHAAAEPDYAITYTVTVADDGSALWRVEYRTLLPTDGDVDDFEAYASELQSVYLPQFRELMERSAAQAAVATGRYMAVSGVTGDTVVQESPTGRYGVVVYTARWDGFALPGDTISIGDAFTGGLYLEKDSTLIIRYPEGYTVTRADPAPDDTRDGLAWYGQRSFGAGEPRVVLAREAFPLLPAAAGLALVIVIAFAGFAFFRRKKRRAGETGADLPAPAAPLSEAELMSLEDRIVQLLGSHGGELFQSEIVRMAGLPKSTVSTALNALHARGMIVKVKKGRENLIRLAPPGTPADERR
jgi:hypothetical protein